MDKKASSVNEYLKSTRISEIIGEGLKEITQEFPKDSIGALVSFLRGKAEDPTIAKVCAREILDSQGIPTVEIDVFAYYLGGVQYVCTSSISAGLNNNERKNGIERDTQSSMYDGKSISSTVRLINEKVSSIVRGIKIFDQKILDAAMISNEQLASEKNFKFIILAVSIAVAEAAAILSNNEVFAHMNPDSNLYEIPNPCFTLVDGGKNANNKLKIQEIMIYFEGEMAINDKVRMAAEIYQKLGQMIMKEHGIGVGLTGGYSPQTDNLDQLLVIIEKAIEASGYHPNSDVFIGINAAGYSLFDGNEKKYAVEGGSLLTPENFLAFWKLISEKHPSVRMIVDPFSPLDVESWKSLKSALGEDVLIITSHVTCPESINKEIELVSGIDLCLMDSTSVTDILEYCQAIKVSERKLMISAGTYETSSTIISDISVAVGATFFKAGAPSRGERVAKYNRLIQIHDCLIDNENNE